MGADLAEVDHPAVAGALLGAARARGPELGLVQIAVHPLVVAVVLDMDTPTGRDIPIEERPEDEVLAVGSRRVAPEGVPARYPAFDVTPAGLVTAIVTERGVLRPPLDRALAEVADRS